MDTFQVVETKSDRSFGGVELCYKRWQPFRRNVDLGVDLVGLEIITTWRHALRS